jgi:hypothetical protein
MNLRSEQNLMPERFQKDVFALTPEERNILRIGYFLIDLQLRLKTG